MKNYCIEELIAMSSQNFTYYASEVMANVKYDDAGKCVNVEIFNKNDNIWVAHKNPMWNWGIIYYRIKPEQKYVPYKKVQYEWLGKAVINKSSGDGYIIIGVFVQNNKLRVNDVYYSIEEFFSYYTWADGSPFGKLVEEEEK